MRGNDAQTREFYGGDCVTGIYGELSFRQSVYDEQEHLQAACGLEEIVNEKPEMDEIVRVVANIFEVSVVEILMKKQGQQKRNIARQVGIFGCQRLGLHKQKDIAEYFSLSHRGSVSSAINAIEGSIESGYLKNRFDQIRRDLNFTKRT